MTRWVYWCTGLSGAGKSSVTDAAAQRLTALGRQVQIIDGDDVRKRLHCHLGFSRVDILENNRLIAEMCAKASNDVDLILVPIISPFYEGRSLARDMIAANFRLIYFSAPLRHVEAVDVKGLYKMARRGEISNMIGVAKTAPYEPPGDADLEIDISSETAHQSTDRLTKFILSDLHDD